MADHEHSAAPDSPTGTPPAAPDAEDLDDLWSLPLSEFRQRTAGPDATPGGGSVSSVTATLGAGLVEMAMRITARKAERAGDSEDWDGDVRRVQSLAEDLAGAAAADVIAFETLMSAYKLPRDGDTKKQERKRAIAEASTAATEVPLTLAEAITEVVALAASVVARVDDAVRSDVLAGADILAGSFHAAVRTVDINLPAVDDDARTAFERRRDDATHRLDDARRRLGGDGATDAGTIEAVEDRP